MPICVGMWGVVDDRGAHIGWGMRTTNDCLLIMEVFEYPHEEGIPMNP